MRDGQLVEAVEIEAPDGYGHVLFGALDELLARHLLRVADIALFAAACGPGSFTGLRVALAAVKGLAEAGSKRVVGVSNLQALAWYGTSEIRAPYLDARREQIYAGLFDSQLRPLAEETVASFDLWRGQLPDGAELITAEKSLAPAVAAIAHQRLLAGEWLDPAAIEANYVRRADAEMKWKDN